MSAIYGAASAAPFLLTENSKDMITHNNPITLAPYSATALGMTTAYIHSTITALDHLAKNTSGKLPLSVLQAFLQRMLYAFTYPYQYTGSRNSIDVVPLSLVRKWNGTEATDWEFVATTDNNAIDALRIDFHEFDTLISKATSYDGATIEKSVCRSLLTKLSAAVLRICFGEQTAPQHEKAVCAYNNETYALCIFLRQLPEGWRFNTHTTDSLYIANF